jgi:prepilin-type N-terminal cleavage/methylation domain-containing protein
VDAFSCPERTRADHGFTLVEVLICTLVLTTGLVGTAGLLAVTTQMHVGAREASRSTRLARDKVNELMKLNLSSDAEVSVGGSLTADVEDHFDTPIDGVTVRWAVSAAPDADTRALAVRVINRRAQQYGREIDLNTIIRQW